MALRCGTTLMFPYNEEATCAELYVVDIGAQMPLKTNINLYHIQRVSSYLIGRMGTYMLERNLIDTM